MSTSTRYYEGEGNQRLRKNNAPQTEQVDIFSEPALVVLSILYFLEPSWVADIDKFNRINKEGFDAVIGDLFDNNEGAEQVNEETKSEVSQIAAVLLEEGKQSEILAKINKTLQTHKDTFEVTVIATEEQRQNFLEAKNEASVH